MLQIIHKVTGAIAHEFASASEFDLQPTQLITRDCIHRGIGSTTHKVVKVADSDKITQQRQKERRTAEIASITVTTSVGTFDGDEESQVRMACELATMEDGDFTNWVLSNNTTVAVTRAQLKEALKAAKTKMTEIWLAPYAK